MIDSLAFLALTFGAAPQVPPGSTFVPAAAGLRTGQEIYVIVDAPCTASGCAGEWVRGRITRIGNATVTVQDERALYELETADIRLVARAGDRVIDGMAKGALTGLLTGLVYLLVAFASNCIECVDSAWLAPPRFVRLTVGIGAALGGILDARNQGYRIVWQRTGQASARAVVTPIVSGGAAGLRLSFRF